MAEKWFTWLYPINDLINRRILITRYRFTLDIIVLISNYKRSDCALSDRAGFINIAIIVLGGSMRKKGHGPLYLARNKPIIIN